ncbi:MAG: magnesium/cobalt transporter CorA [Candidatus Latescibacteria bacterium]|nr:magnesium/cobalt transporter CorA [Candidatus Latescibacterota bacterium]
MSRLTQRRLTKTAQSPGTVEYVGKHKVENVEISVFDYGPGSCQESTPTTLAELLPHRDSDTVTWIDIDGLHDTALLQGLGAHFGFHPLVLEDVVNTHQRPKLEDYGDYLYIVVRMLSYDAERRELGSDQVSLLLGERYVFSLQESWGDVFDPVRERLRSGKGRIRGHGPDYLAYALLDAVVDNYFVILEQLGEEIEELETQLVEDPQSEQQRAVHELKREMILLRKSVWPLREVLAGLERTESGLLRTETRVFIRDVYDHAIQVIDVVESFRDMLSGLQDLYLSSISNKTNEVMKVLTIIGTIFIPVTFLAGVYGMNFQYFPELAWKWSYPTFWAISLIVGGVMLNFFRRRKWL